MKKPSFRTACVLLISLLACGTGLAQRQMERLGRGVIALKSSSTQVYVGWRLLGNDPSGIAFNLYRSANGAAAVKVNSTPLTATTDYLDTPASLSTTAYTYSVKPVLNGSEVADTWANPLSAGATLPANAPTRQYIPVPMQPTPDDAAAGVSYDVKFCWVGDFDGDGEYDFLVDRTNPNVEAKQWLQAYKRDGTLLWQMDMGPNSVDHYNITPGSSSIGIGHGDNVTVYDLDGDGMAEVVVRTANGVVFPNGTTLAAPNNEVQYISIIDGLTGSEKARATVPIPASWVTKTHVQGQMGVFYPDGVRPSIFFHPSNRNPDSSFNKCAITWDYRNGLLTQRWIWLESGHTAEGHQIRFADVDNDGKDEFVDIGNIVKSDGSGQINGDVLTEVVHGDRFHVTDIDPDRPGQETFLIQQNNGTGLATVYSAADKSSVIKKWYAGGVVDVGRGVVGDFVPAVKGCEFFSTMPGVFDAKTNQLYASGPFPPETIWWDGDLGREFLSTIGSSATSPGIDKFNTTTGGTGRVISLYSEPAAPNSPYNNYIAYGGRPQFWGDILGDWREELICVATDNSELRIYSTKTPDTAKTGGGVPFRIYTLMHNPQYRIQATTKGYVQSSYVDYYLGTGMTPPAPPPMVDAKLVWKGGGGTTTWDAGTTASWTNNGANSTFAASDSVRFDISGNSTTTVGLSGTLQPGAVTVFSPSNHTFDGTGGSLSGSMTLMKSGSGTMTLSGSHPFTGATTVWDGALSLSGTLPSSPVTVWGGTFGGAPAAGQTGGRIAGTGTFSQPVSLKYRGAITPGSGMGNAGTLTLGGLSAEEGSYLAFDLSNDPSGTVTPSDRIVINGNLSVSGTVGIVVKALNGQLAPGTYTLATYTGTLTGSISNFSVTVPPGTPYSLAAGSGSVRLIVPVTRAAGSVVWRGSGAAWDLATSQNWLLGASPDVFVSGDTVTFDATGAANPAVTLNGILPVAGITVSSAGNYTFSGSGSISGAGGITKSGAGTLTISTNNDYTGPTIINGGVLAVNALGDAGAPSAIGAAAAASSNFIINGGTLQLTGAQTNTNRNLSLGASGGTLDVATAGSSMQISGVVSGSGKLTKTGVGTLILASANSHTGGTLISGGTIYLAGAVANSSALGSGTVTISNGTLTMADVQASETAAWNIVVPAGAAARVNADGRCQLSGTLTGAGDLTFYTPYVRTEMDGNWSAFTGRIYVVSDADGGNFRIRNSAGYPTAALDLGEDVYAFYNQSPGSSLTIPVGTLSGAATSVLAGCNSASRTITWQVGARNEDSLFAGIIANATGPSALTKTGSGILTLSGACVHTGATTVQQGTLRINGTTTGSAFTVQPAAALGGGGGITGNVSVQAGGVIEHGASGATPLGITGNLTVAGQTLFRPIPAAVLNAGTITVLTYTGSIVGTPSFSWVRPVGSPLVGTFNVVAPDGVNPGRVELILTPGGRAPGPITWTGAIGFDWDTTTGNWQSGGSATTYQAGDSPSFTDSGNATSPVNLVANVEPAAVAVDAAKNYTFGGTGIITGTASLTKSGSGTLTLTSTNNYSGTTTIGGGTLVLGSNASFTSGGIGTGEVIFENGTLSHTFNGNNTVVYNNVLSAAAGRTGTILTPNRFRLNGAVTGAGTLNMAIATTVSRADFQNSFTGFSGNFNLTGSGTVRVGINSLGTNQPLFDASGWANTALSVDGVAVTPTITSARTILIGALASTGTAGSLGSGTGGMATYSIGAKNLDTTYAGILSGTNAAVTKTGTGTLTLGGANTYTGATTVTSGTLSVTGSLGATATTVATTGRLAGSGTIGGAVTCNGTLAPIGTLTLSAGLVLSSTSILDYDLGTTSDRTSVTGNLTLDGTVNVTPSAGFTAGTYTLITYTGTLSNNALAVGTLPANYTGSINTSTAGQVRLVVTQVLTAYEQWQVSHFSSTSSAEAQATADPDRDGTSNETEFRLGLDPKNGSSSFKAAGSMAAGGYTLTWPSAPGLLFEIRRSPSLDGSWDLLETANGVGTYTDTNPLPGQGFYRIVLLP